MEEDNGVTLILIMRSFVAFIKIGPIVRLLDPTLWVDVCNSFDFIHYPSRELIFSIARFFLIRPGSIKMFDSRKVCLNHRSLIYT